MIIDLLRMLIEVAAALFGVTLLMRACMNWLGVPARNPLAQFTLALTDWVVLPLRRLIHPIGRVDLASLAAAYLVAVLELALIFSLVGAGIDTWPWAKLLLFAALQVLRWALNLVVWLTIIHVVLSWLNPDAPIAPLIGMMVRPFLAPFQRILPTIGGVDLSPLVLILLVNMVLLVVGRAGF